MFSYDNFLIYYNIIDWEFHEGRALFTGVAPDPADTQRKFDSEQVTVDMRITWHSDIPGFICQGTWEVLFIHGSSTLARC